MQKLPRFVQNGPTSLVCKLKESLYEHPKIGMGKIHTFSLNCVIPCYIHHHDGQKLIVVLYINDIIINGHP